MKRLISFLLLVCMLCVLASCNAQPIETIYPDETAPNFLDYTFSEDFPQELRMYAAPWVTDVCADAIRDGKINYYFMSGKGMMMDPKVREPYKWGDSTLVVFPNGQTMLIDVGMAAYAPVLAENLKRMGIERLDYLMISHPHGDHCGGIIADDCFLDMIAVDSVLYSGIVRGSTTQKIDQQCADRNIPIQIVKQGDTFQFGDTTLSILWPKDGTAGKKITSTPTINNNSIIARFDYGQHSSLFVGDLYVLGEAQVIADCGSKMDADLLKVPHHGYSTSSSRVLISTVTPDIAVAMSGYNSNVHRRYEAMGAYYLFDRYDGYIRVFSDGETMRYDTDRTGHS